MGIVASVLSLLGIGGCDHAAQKALRAGISTAADVRALMGAPDTIWEEADGRRVFEYPRGPAGFETYMVELSADGLFVSMRNVLTEPQFALVGPGMLRDDLRRLLGRPTETQWFEGSQDRVWSWKYQTQEGRAEYFNVHFGAGTQVVSTSRSPDPERINAQ